MLGLDALAADPSLGAAQQDDIALMRASAACMQQVLNDTLDIEKMGAGMYVVVARPTRVRGLLERVRYAMGPLARQERVALDIRVGAATPPAVLLDSARMFQILSNLVSNAVKFGHHDGTGTVTVTASVTDDPTAPYEVVEDATDAAPSTSLRSPRPSPAVEVPERGDCADAVLLRVTTCVDAAAARGGAWLRATMCGGWDSNGEHVAAVSPLLLGVQPARSARDAGCGPVTAASEETHIRPELPQPLGAALTPPGGSSTGSGSTRPDGWLRFDVADNGAGITPEARRTLFRAFSQMEAGQLQAAKGSGLGLFICREIVQRMGGSITVESHRTTPGLPTGSVFRVEVPLVVAQCSTEEDDMAGDEGEEAAGEGDRPFTSPSLAAAAEREAVGVSGAAAAPAFFATPSMATAATTTTTRAGASAVPRRPRPAPRSPLPPSTSILVVDDDVASRMFLSRSLARMNPACHVDVAENGAVALSKLAARPVGFDVVCIDREMPVMDGLTAAAAIRRHGYRCVLIGVTGALLSEEVATFLAAGAEAVVEKPVDLCKLQVTMRSLLQARDRRDAAAAAVSVENHHFL